MSQKGEDSFFLVSYRDPKDGQIVSLKAKEISDSSLGLGFVRISNFLFQTEGLLVQPAEEQLKKRFENVKSFHLSLYSIISIEEMGMKHVGLNFKNDKSKILSFPDSSSHTPPPQNWSYKNYIFGNV